MEEKMNRDILAVVQESMPTFSKGQRRIANYILESYDKAAFMTASKLGKIVGVSESTVVRFAAELGYDGYPSMQRSLQKMIRRRLNSVQRIEVSNDRIGDHDILSTVLQSDMEKIRLTLEAVDRDSFELAADAIVSARRIYIIGVRSAAAIVTFLSFNMHLIFDNVITVSTNTVSEIFERLIRVGPEDVVIGVSFPRYSRRTVEAMRLARDRGATTIAITDSDASPLAPIATYLLKARSDMVSFVDSLVAPLSLANALLVAVSRRKSGELSQTFQTLEKIWDEYGVYEKPQDDRKAPCSGRRRGRDDGRHRGGRARGGGDLAGTRPQGGPQAVYHRQGPVQRDQSLHAPAGAGVGPRERTISLRSHEPHLSGGCRGVFHRPWCPLESRAGQPGLSPVG